MNETETNAENEQVCDLNAALRAENETNQTRHSKSSVEGAQSVERDMRVIKETEK